MGASMSSIWSFALWANCGGTIFFFFIAINDKFSWLVEFVCMLCFISNLLWIYMFHELGRSQTTKMVFASLAAVALLSAILHWRRPLPDPDSDEDTDSDSDSEDLMEEEKIKREQAELQRLRALKARMSSGSLNQRKPIKNADETNDIKAST